MHLALVGPRTRFAGAASTLRNLGRLSSRDQEAATAGEGGWTWLGRYVGPIGASVGALQDEWNPVIEFSLPRARYSNDLNLASSLQALLSARPNLQSAEALLGVADQDKEVFERSYAATELMVRSWLASLRGADDEADRLIQIAHHANPKDRWVAYALADRMLTSLPQARAAGIGDEEALRRILTVNPNEVEAVRALWHFRRDRGDSRAASTRAQLLELSPLDREALQARD
jgi:hypothetical protein